MLLSEPLLRTAVPLVLFCSSHVGLSNVREPLIEGFGTIAAKLQLTNTGINLPRSLVATKISKEKGGEVQPDVEFWPNEKVAGRQIFRIFYSAIAFYTLGYSLSSYYEVMTSISSSNRNLDSSGSVGSDSVISLLCMTVASLAQGISIASLANPSPLSLVPAWVPTSSSLSSSSPDRAGVEVSSRSSSSIITRDDSLKLRPYGLTRITRHPLILPVLPWGISNAILAGGSELDWIMFGGLGIYAVVGCYAQDERAKRNAAVGTVFAEGDLTEFYDSTSFAPFVALADGRQKWKDVVREVENIKIVYILAIIVGFYLESTLVEQFSKL